MILLK
jgi:hypothetical protein